MGRRFGRDQDEETIVSTILEVKDLKKYFPIRKASVGVGRQFVRAVDGIDLTLRRGEVLGLIGESGAGKSTIGIASMGFARVSQSPDDCGPDGGGVG